MTMCAMRACCAAGAGRGTGVTVPVDRADRADSDAGAWETETTAPVLVDSMPVPAPDARTAWHESSHVVAALAVGATVTSVTVGIGAAATIAPHPSRYARIFTLLAGPLAEHLHSNRLIATPSDEELKFFLRNVRAIEMGCCDFCKIFMNIIGGNPSADDGKILSLYRNIEKSTVKWLRNRSVYATIQRLSGDLMRRTTLNEAEILRVVGATPIPHPDLEA